MSSPVVKRDAQQAEAFRAMEGEIIDLVDMVSATTMLSELYDQEKRSAGRCGRFSADDLVKHLEAWSVTVAITLDQVHTMAVKLSQRYE